MAFAVQSGHGVFEQSCGAGVDQGRGGVPAGGCRRIFPVRRTDSPLNGYSYKNQSNCTEKDRPNLTLA